MASLGGHHGDMVITASGSHVLEAFLVELFDWSLNTNDPMFESTIFPQAGTRPNASSWKAGLPAYQGHLRGYLPQGLAYPASDLRAYEASQPTVGLTLRHEDAATDFTIICTDVCIYNVVQGVTVSGGAPLNTLECDFQFRVAPTAAGAV